MRSSARWSLWVVGLLTLMAMAVEPAAAQGRLAQGMVKRRSGEALAGVLVEVPGTFQSTTSRVDGTFVITIAAGTDSLRFRRIGFEAVTIATDSLRAAPMLVVLHESLTALRGVVVAGERVAPMSATITRETVRQLPALVEPDVLRALPFLPGVHQPNDLLGVVHLAGASGDETAFAMDDHPMQFPSHLGGIFGAYNAGAIERADVLLHHVPPTTETRLGGTVRLHSRRVESRPTREVYVSMLAAGAAMTQPDLWRGTDLLVAARMTYLDRLLGALKKPATSGGDDIIAPTYRDAVVRVGTRWGSNWTSQLLLYGTQDASKAVGMDGAAPLAWGETLLGATLAREGRSSRLTIRASRNNAYSHDRTLAATGREAIDNAQTWHSAAVSLRDVRGQWRHLALIGVQHRDQDHEWNAPDRFQLSGIADVVERRQRQTQATAAFETGRATGRGGSASVGMRFEHVGGSSFVAPRISWTHPLFPRIDMDVAIDRRYQFDTQFGVQRTGSMTQPLFLLDRPRRADMAALGLRWNSAPNSGRQAIASLTGFTRFFADRTVPHAPGFAVAESVTFDRVSGRAHGLAAAMSYSSEGGAVVQGAYTFQVTRQRLETGWHPTPWDLPHTFTMFASAAPWHGFSFGAALQIHSGAAVSPLEFLLIEPAAPGQSGIRPRLTTGAPYSARLAGYGRLDLAIRRNWRVRSSEWTASLQALNVVYRQNPLSIDWLEYFQLGGRGEADRFPRQAGIGLVPSLGLEVRW